VRVGGGEGDGEVGNEVLERLGGIAGAWIVSSFTDLGIVLAVVKDFVGCLWYSTNLYGGADKSECQELHRVLHTLNFRVVTAADPLMSLRACLCWQKNNDHTEDQGSGSNGLWYLVGSDKSIAFFYAMLCLDAFAFRYTDAQAHSPTFIKCFYARWSSCTH